MANCLATYGKRCRAGVVVVAEIRRPVGRVKSPKRSLKIDAGEEVGAVVEIIFDWDQWRITQARGFANGPARKSAVDAAIKLLTSINEALA
jgi:hypothetical protein